MLDTRELADDKTFEQRKIRQTMTHPAVGNYVMSGWPVRFGDEPPAVGPAPLLGQHSGDVLADWLEDGWRYDRQVEGRQGDRGMKRRL